MGRELRRVWEVPDLDSRSILCEFFVMASLPESVRLWHVLREMETGWTTRGPRMRNQRGVTILTVPWYKGVELSN